jgi:trigger factor
MISFEQGKNFECLITFEVLPDISVKSFKDIALDVLAVTIDDKDVEQRLQKLCAEHIRYQSSVDGRPARKGDLILVKWSGTLEDGKGIELPETYQILLGPEKADSPFAPVVKALYGKKPGDKFEEKVQFSKEEKVSDLAGKKASIKVEVQKVEEPITFKLDNAFAKEFNFETLEELRQSVRSSVEHEGRKVAHLYTKRNLLDALDAQYSFDLPPTMVENEFRAIWAQLQRELTEARANGDLDEEDEKKSEAELKADYEAIAKRRVRLGLLISHLADVNKLKLSDEEVRMAVLQEAMRYPNQTDEVIKYYVNNNQALRNLVAPLLEDKVVDFILANSNVTERKVDFPTLKKVVRGVIPTPYDEEVDDTEEDKKASKVASSKGKKPTKAKGK